MSEQRQSTIVEKPTVREPKAVILERSPTVRLDISQANQTARYFQERIKQEKDNPEAVAELTRQKELNRQAHVQEMSLLHAASIKALYETVAAHPFSSKEEILRIIKETTPVLTPDLVEALAKQIEVTSESIRTLKNHFSSDDGTLNTEILANYILANISDVEKIKASNAFLSPKEVHCTDTVVTLTVTADAFACIYGSEGAAGLFIRKVSVPLEGRKTATFPAIILIDKMEERVTQHEAGHSENAFYKQTFNGSQIEDPMPVALDHSWGKGRHHTDLSLSYSSLETRFKKSTSKQKPSAASVEAVVTTGNIEQTKEFQDCIDYALSKAKDELLAEMHATKGDPSWHLGNLKNPQGIYRYFTHLTENIDPTLHALLWNEYTKQLTEFSREALQLHAEYSKHSVFTARKELLPYVLMNIPIDKWNEQLGQKGYLAEMKMYQKVENTKTMLHKHTTDLSVLPNISSDPKKIRHFEDMTERYQQITHKNRSLFENVFDSSHSLILELAQMESKIDSLFAEHLETEYAQLALAVSSITEDYKDATLSHNMLVYNSEYTAEQYWNIRKSYKFVLEKLDSRLQLEEKLRHNQEELTKIQEIIQTLAEVNNLSSEFKGSSIFYNEVAKIKNITIYEALQEKSRAAHRLFLQKMDTAATSEATKQCVHEYHAAVEDLVREVASQLEAEKKTQSGATLIQQSILQSLTGI